MKINHKRRALLAAAVLATAAIVGVSAIDAHAQDQTGATATKECPQAPVNDPYTIGDTVQCTATFTNDGAFAATVTEMIDISPFISSGSPGNGAPQPLTCTLPDGTTVIQVGSTLEPGVVCTAQFGVTIPNDPALCNTVFRDLAQFALSYPQFDPPLEAGAFATHTLLVICRPSISVTKVADTLSKVGDPVNYTIEVCNTGAITVTKTSVTDSLIADVNAAFGATLTAGQCESHVFTRTVAAGDPDPLVNTVTADYTAGIQTAHAEASATTNLFQPAVDVTKTCGPNPTQVGMPELCQIVITNTSSSDAPGLVNGTIADSLTGNLLDPANTAIVNSTCTASLASGASCTINTRRTVLASDPNPLVNTVTVHYNPQGFPNDITDSASASVAVVAPSITVTKSADTLSKPGDPVAYTITICNNGSASVTRNSVTDTLVGDIAANFAATLAAGQCSEYSYSRTVLPADPDPLVNTVTAVYGSGPATATATASATTNLFQPSIDVTKNCTPDPIRVGQAELCTIVISNTSSADAPNLVRDSIVDSLSGDLTVAGNVVDSTCGADLASGASCTIHTSRVVAVTDVSPLVNTVVVHYHPAGFPNDITDTASDSVVIERGGEGCTPGYWKQPQHLDSWVGYSPTDSFEAVFGVDVTLTVGGQQVTNPTLLQALEAQGGGVNALARHAVAALLNSSNGGVDSNYTTAQVIAIVQEGIAPGGLTIEQAKNLLAAANEQGCPLN